MTYRPDFNPLELEALFTIRDSLLHGLMLERKPRMAITLTFHEASAQNLLSALQQLLED